METNDILQEILNELRRQNAAKPATEREIMNIKQAAEYLGQSEWTLREWVRMRKIPFNRINGCIKFKKSRLDRWVDKGENPVW